ncbi:LysR family transcriptional regulator [Streptoalloteichus hindustanus]|uniref:DNA-binding transcriptional regulator, LysR family n=1 Tax=Streptoalloteichus hindustanus TaxID=2017 RepID=A0A1M5MS51_STRHI|nr:LysR family transcriptional regulator [Streptoalloteichus hindustanus]SHG80056.1 DNA-binding transcriptional regulator, LysR family [Streptoalloteichus hindustanus]
MELDTHHLRLVRAIGETGSLSKAAVLLGVSQPAVSYKLKRLETLLGQRLFERGGSAAVVPTPTGELLLRRALAVLPLMEDFLHDIESRAHNPVHSDQIRLGTVCTPVIERVLTVLNETFPMSRVSMLAYECSVLLLSMVAQHRLELAIVKEYPGFELDVPPGVRTEVITKDPSMVVLPAGHPFAERSEITLESLAGERWVLPPPGANRFHEYFRATCWSLGFVPNVTHTAETCAETNNAVRAGAVGLSQGVCEMNARNVLRPLTTNILDRRFIMAWHRDGPFADNGSAVAAAARTAYRDRLRSALTAYGCADFWADFRADPGAGLWAVSRRDPRT